MLIVILHYWVYQVNKSYPFNWLHVSYTLNRHLTVYLKMLHVSYTSVKLGSQKRKKIAVNVGKMCMERQIENMATVFHSGNLDADKVSFLHLQPLPALWPVLTNRMLRKKFFKLSGVCVLRELEATALACSECYPRLSCKEKKKKRKLGLIYWNSAIQSKTKESLLASH